MDFTLRAPLPLVFQPHQGRTQAHFFSLSTVKADDHSSMLPSTVLSKGPDTPPTKRGPQILGGMGSPDGDWQSFLTRNSCLSPFALVSQKIRQ